LTAITTSNGATGSTNSAPDSYTPIGVLVLLSNMLIGEMVFGGLGTGIYSIVFVAVLGLFLCGLMVGRTPDYLGKTITRVEIQMVAIYSLMAPAFILFLTAIATLTKQGTEGLTTNSGSHGFTEILFAYTSAFANNGQSMGGLTANSSFYNFTTAIAMMGGRFMLAIPALALAGAFARQGRRATTSATLRTDDAMFGAIIIATVLLLTLLSFFPALALGPIIEHYQLRLSST
jgi:K+-transporting ATPase ATPase A chain